MNKLTDRERKLLRIIIEAWDKECLLPGDLSYQDVFDLCDKFDIPYPLKISKILKITNSNTYR